MGLYLFAPDAYDTGIVTETAFVHKGRCDDAMVATGRFQGWGPLSSFIIFLAAHANLEEVINPEAARHAI